MPYRQLIGIDWGTSTMRAILCSCAAGESGACEVLVGPGVARLSDSFENALFKTIDPWLPEHAKVPITMSGMVGSDIGWKATPYVASPVAVHAIRQHCLCFVLRDHPVTVLPGLSCRNAFSQPDFMRGEELQILGWYRERQEPADGEFILCLPGTHTKWVHFAHGTIVSFTTSLCGELFEVLRKYSVLLPSVHRLANWSDHEPSFREGLDLARRSGGNLINTLFTVRSRRIAAMDPDASGAAYLSGLIIGADVATALAHYRIGQRPVELIGDPALCKRFGTALEYFGATARATNGVDAACHGFSSFCDGI